MEKGDNKLPSIGVLVSKGHKMIKLKESRWSVFLIVLVAVTASNSLDAQTRELPTEELEGCLKAVFSLEAEPVIIDGHEAFLSMIKKRSYEACKRTLKKIDSDEYSIIGVEIDTNYCGKPDGLVYDLLQDEESKRYSLQVSYLKAELRCRGHMSYSLWLKVPKIPKGYIVEYEIEFRE